MFLSFSFLSRKNNLFCLSTSCSLQAKLIGCWKEYLYPLSSRSLFPRPLYVDQELLREEHCSTSWFAGGALAGPLLFCAKVEEEEGDRKFVLNAAEGEQGHGCSWH